MNKSLPITSILDKSLPINFSQNKKFLTEKLLPSETKAINQIFTE